MNAVVSIGPISVSGAAEPWQTYESGVFTRNCGADVDHAIVLDGYGACGPHALVDVTAEMPWTREGFICVNAPWYATS